MLSTFWGLGRTKANLWRLAIGAKGPGCGSRAGAAKLFKAKDPPRSLASPHSMKRKEWDMPNTK